MKVEKKNNGALSQDSSREILQENEKGMEVLTLQVIELENRILAEKLLHQGGNSGWLVEASAREAA